ncbi:Amt4 [Purpureocillium lavendulum]|uniref:Amt4 n=1 Tax=Purpureocillium lavendulum TaxID=1247861 RepID=A0AB34G2G2_9HYPO|nr:Amt4 [Purpureocillium lavendulum]
MFPGGPNPIQVQFVPPYKQASSPHPLVFIHDGGGTVFSYFILGALNRDVWAIYNPKYFAGEAWEGGMDEMARHYIDLIVEAGVTGSILLGGWSLGGFLSLTIARMLAEDPSKKLSVAGFLIIDSPYHIARAKLTQKTTRSKIDGIPPLVQKAFDNCDVMLRHWDLPSWDGPSDGGKETKLRAGGRGFTLQPGTVLHKPLNEAWKEVGVKQYQHESTVDKPIAPPPGVMIRCTRHTQKAEGAGPEPALIDIFRDETLLGWEGNHADFLKAVIDVDADHYGIFDRDDQSKMEALTSQVNAGLEILDSITGPCQTKSTFAFF